jgi:hypothetical protein
MEGPDEIPKRRRSAAHPASALNHDEIVTNGASQRHRYLKIFPQHHLTFAILRLRPTTQEQFKFFIAPDQFSQSASAEGIEAALYGRGAHRRPGSYGR